jgi:hypothetical protein
MNDGFEAMCSCIGTWHIALTIKYSACETDKIRYGMFEVF